ncbi:MAG TPA: FAD-dependent oxidoreductase [Conexibacter sp.]|nr:FAD-dependent oxidoreductase [Conexibacter sp.]
MAARSPSEAAPVVVIGAGPHGLAAVANLRGAGIPTRVFGEPLSFWRETMPAGMLLRSSDAASDIHDPDRALTLKAWAAASGRTIVEPIPIGDFVDYGRWFCERVAPDLDRRRVATVARSGRELVVTLADGERIAASRVVVAAGLGPFARIPSPFRELPEQLRSHTSAAGEPERFAGRSVAVIGGGQSALEGAALLHEAGARVETIVRAPRIFWLGADGPATHAWGTEIPPATGPRAGEANAAGANGAGAGANGAAANGDGGGRASRPGFRARHGLYWRAAPTEVGGRVTGWIGAAPDVCRLMPRGARVRLADDAVKAAAAYWLRDRLRPTTLTLGRRVVAADEQDGRVRLRLDDDGERVVDHVVLGTGYAMDARRYPFLAPELAAELRVVDGYPLLRRGLESSVPGLHFLGAPAYLSFGPAMRFVVGTAYDAPALAQGILGRRRPLFRWAF